MPLCGFMDPMHAQNERRLPMTGQTRATRSAAPGNPRRAGVLAAALLLLPLWLAAAPPEIATVEPPSWWAGSSPNTVSILIRGRNLAGAEVRGGSDGLQAGNVRVNAAGTCLFVEVTINPQARPGPHPLKLATADGSILAPFQLLRPLAPEGRFQGFSIDDVIYLIMPDRFADGDPANNDPAAARGLFDRQKPRYYHGGDFQGIKNHLDYLKGLGVTTLWLTPWYDNANQLNQREKYNRANRLDAQGEPSTDYHGYGAVDFYDLEEHFGDLRQLQELVDAAHRAGLKIVQDQVPNHTGPYHPWTTNSPTPTWYNGTPDQHLTNRWQTAALTNPQAPADQRQQTLEGWFIGILPDLNQNDADCARYLIQNSRWWIGVTGLDGIRLDTLPYVPRAFWRDWRAAMHNAYPTVSVVGEMFDGNAAIVSFFQGGRARFDGVDSGIESLFDFPLYYAIRRAFAEGGSLTELTRVLEQDSLYPDARRLVTFLGSHDVARFMNERGADAAGLQLAFAFLLTTRGIPMIYYGDEIGLPGGPDPDNRRDFPGGFPGDTRDAFTDAGRTAAERALFDHVRRLLHLRAGFEPLRRGRLVNLLVSDRRYAYARVGDGGTALVLLNSAPQTETLEGDALVIGLPEGSVLPDRLGSAPPVRVENGRWKATLPPRSALVATTASP
jgi:neopullulanase